MPGTPVSGVLSGACTRGALIEGLWIAATQTFFWQSTTTACVAIVGGKGQSRGGKLPANGIALVSSVSSRGKTRGSKKACRVDCKCRTPLGGSTSAGCIGASVGRAAGAVARAAIKRLTEAQKHSHE